MMPAIHQSRRIAIPTSPEVEAFSVLYAKRFSVNLSPEEALLLATHYLHMYQLLNELDTAPLC